jgi:hypothetical protein
MRRRRLVLAAAVLAGFGVAKLPLERMASAKLQQAGMQAPFVEVGLWENLGQMGFAAALGGLRALVAGVTYMRAYMAFEEVEWAQVDSFFQLTTRLQPRDESYWDEASWHMAFNAASHYLHRPDIDPVTRGKLYHAHIQRGLEILEEGLRYNPGQIRLLARLGDTHARRTLQPELAAKVYLQVAELGGPPRYRRLAAYEFLKTADRALWEGALAILREEYVAGRKFPSVIAGIKDLERRLQIPEVERIPDPEPPGPGMAP